MPSRWNNFNPRNSRVRFDTFMNLFMKINVNWGCVSLSTEAKQSQKAFWKNQVSWRREIRANRIALYNLAIISRFDVPNDRSVNTIYPRFVNRLLWLILFLGPATRPPSRDSPNSQTFSSILRETWIRFEPLTGKKMPKQKLHYNNALKKKKLLIL